MCKNTLCICYRLYAHKIFLHIVIPICAFFTLPICAIWKNDPCWSLWFLCVHCQGLIFFQFANWQKMSISFCALKRAHISLQTGIPIGCQCSQWDCVGSHHWRICCKKPNLFLNRESITSQSAHWDCQQKFPFMFLHALSYQCANGQQIEIPVWGMGQFYLNVTAWTAITIRQQFSWKYQFAH